MRAKIICIANFKGGVGKTTSTLNIGYVLANKNLKICLIDLDPQANLTISLGLECREPSVYGFLINNVSFNQLAIKLRENITILPSHLSLIQADVSLSSMYHREYILEKKLEPYRDQFDYIIIDTAPNIGVLTVNGLVCSDYIFTPIEAEFLALQGFSFLNEALNNIGLEIDGLFVTKYDNRKILNREIFASLQESFPQKLFKTKIRSNISLAESQSKGLDIFSYDPKSHGSQDYTFLTEEIITFLMCKE